MVISALVFGRRLAWLRRSWATADTIPLVCRETVTEVLRVLAYPKFALTPQERETLLADYLSFAQSVGEADLLVSGDADLTDLGDSPPVKVITVEELRRILEG